MQTPSDTSVKMSRRDLSKCNFSVVSVECPLCVAPCLGENRTRKSSQGVRQCYLVPINSTWYMAWYLQTSNFHGREGEAPLLCRPALFGGWSVNYRTRGIDHDLQYYSRSQPAVMICCAGSA